MIAFFHLDVRKCIYFKLHPLLAENSLPTWGAELDGSDYFVCSKTEELLLKSHLGILSSVIQIMSPGSVFS